jgi:hypothetical protein
MIKDVQSFLHYDCLNWLVLYISEVKTFKLYDKYATNLQIGHKYILFLFDLKDFSQIQILTNEDNGNKTKQN